MSDTKAFIKGISYYLPDNILTNENLSQQFPDWSTDKIKTKVGIEKRHVSGADETATDLAIKAAEKLFDSINVDREIIDFVLLCTQSPDYRLPSSSCVIQDRLKLPKTCGAFDYNLGCSGCIYGLAIAKGLITAGIAKNVLLLTAETYTKYIHPEDRSNKSIFGDGAAACLISTDGFAEIGNFVFGTDGSGKDHLIVKTGGSRFPQKNFNSTTDEEGHIWREDYLYMNGGAVFNFTLNVVPPMINDLKKMNNLTDEDINMYIFHQANKFMLTTLRKVCGIPKDKFYIDLTETGNTVSSTVFIALKDCIENGIITKGMKVLTCGFGVGLSWAGVTLSF